MDILEVYRVSLQTLLEVGNAVNVLQVSDAEAPKIDYVHLKPKPFILSDQIEYFTGVITAHKLSQYQNKIHMIRLQEDVETWLDVLIEQDLLDRERILNI